MSDLLVVRFDPDGSSEEKGKVRVRQWLDLFKLAVGAEVPKNDDELAEGYQARLHGEYKKRLFKHISPSVVDALSGRGILEKDWAAIEVAMRQVWEAAIPTGGYAAELRRRNQQEGESVAQFAAVFVTLVRDAGVNLEEFKGAFFAALHPQIRAKFPLDYDPEKKEFTETEAAAKKAEAMLAELTTELMTKKPVAMFVAKKPKCWYCGKEGHVHAKCHKWDKDGRPDLLPFKPKAKFSSFPAVQEQYFPGIVMATTGVGVSVPIVEVLVNGRELAAVLDTGAVASLCSWEAAKTLKLRVYPSRVELQGANGQALRVRGSVRLDVCMDNLKSEASFVVVEGLPVQLVLGVDFLAKSAIKIDLAAGIVSWLGGFKRIIRGDLQMIAAVQARNPRPADWQHQIHQITSKYKQLFSGNGRDFGDAQVPPLHLDVDAGAVPYATSSYRLSPRERMIWKEKIDALRREGIIEPSSSRWACRGHLVEKAGGDWRLVFNFIPLNKYVKLDAYPSPNIEDLMDRLGGTRVFSKLDLASAFLAVPVDEESAEYLAIATPFGHFQFRRMPFGLNVAPKYLQKLMDGLLGDLQGVLCYADDILIAAKTWTEHNNMLVTVLKRLQAQGWLVNLEKCRFGEIQVPFLGRTVSAEGVRPDPVAIEDVLSLSAPRDKSGVKSLLGSLQWFSKFIPGFADLVAPIRSLLPEAVPFSWKEPQEVALQKLKVVLSSEPILAHPNFSKPFRVEADASGVGYGAVLMQEDRPVAYLSRAWKPAEEHLPITFLELLAIIRAVEQWHVYLHGATFTVVTDHKALQWLRTLKNVSGRLAQWAAFLQEYDFEVVYRKGDKQGMADALSRLVGAVLTHIGDSDFVAAQQADPWCSKILKKVNMEAAGFEDFLLNEAGVLCLLVHRFSLPFLHPCVPASLRSTVLQEIHDRLGHPGRDATIRAVAEQWHWPTMREDAKNYVASCVPCANVKDPHWSWTPPLGSLAAKKFNELVACDLMSGLWPTKDGFVYLLVAVDHFSKLMAAAPLRSKSSVEVAEAFERIWINVHGAPGAVLTDQGGEFSGAEFSAMIRRHGIRKAWTTAYHPAGDGVVERMNKVLATGMATSGSRLEWSAMVSQVVEGHNRRTNLATGLPPVAFTGQGLKPTGSLAAVGGGVLASETNQKIAVKTQAARASMAAVAKKETAEAEALQDARKKPWLRRGALVWVKDPSVKQRTYSKVDQSWSGPWKVIGRPHRWTAVVMRHPVGVAKTVNVMYLKPPPMGSEKQKHSRAVETGPLAAVTSTPGLVKTASAETHVPPSTGAGQTTPGPLVSLDPHAVIDLSVVGVGDNLPHPAVVPMPPEEVTHSETHIETESGEEGTTEQVSQERRASTEMRSGEIGRSLSTNNSGSSKNSETGGQGELRAAEESVDERGSEEELHTESHMLDSRGRKETKAARKKASIEEGTGAKTNRGMAEVQSAGRFGVGQRAPRVDYKAMLHSKK